MVLYDDYEKAGFFMLPTGKRQRHSVTDYFIHRLVDFGFTSSCFWLHGRLFITPVAAVVVFLVGIVDAFLRSKLYKVRTQKLLGL
jgi:protoheme IX farnesyltransferase